MNRELLAEKVKLSGKKKYSIAEEIGISPNSLANKLSGRCDFSCNEMIKLAKVIGLDTEELNAIFFGSDVVGVSTEAIG